MHENGAARGAGSIEGGGALNRRAFMASGAAAVAAGLVVAQGPTAFASVARTLTSPAPLGRSRFVPLVNKVFSVAGSRTRLTLVEVDDILGAPAGAENQFSLIFQATDASLPSAIATLKGQGAAVSLYVSPVDRGVTHHFYQAVVNRVG